MPTDWEQNPMNTTPPSHWSVGQKVICIDDRFPPAVVDWCDHLPIAGNIHTIRAIQIGATGTGFLSEGIVNPKSSLGCAAGFLTYRFVPWLDADPEAKRNDAGEPLHLQP